MDQGRIITLPNPHLRERSAKVGLVSPAIRQIIRDMEAATLEWEDGRQHEVGVALAAIQIDRPLRVIVVRHDFNDKQNRSFDVFINPVITKFEGVVEEDFEGCLSVKDIYGKVPRYSKVRVKAQNLVGKEIRLTAEGFLARVFQHEIDHTNGIMLVDHIQDRKTPFIKLLLKEN